MRRRRRNVNNDCGEEKEDLKKGRGRKEGGRVRVREREDEKGSVC